MNNEPILDQSEIIAEETAETAPKAEAPAPKQPAFRLKLLPLNLRNVTAVLCALVILFSLFAFSASDPMAVISYGNGMVDQIKADIQSYETKIDNCRAAIKECEQSIEDLQARLPDLAAAMTEAEAAVAPAQEAAAEAEAALDEVCTRNTYSSFYCTEDCKPAHDAFSAALSERNKLQDAADKAAQDYDNAEYQIAGLEDEIVDLNEDIADYESSIASCKERISQLRSQFVGQWFVLIARTVGLLLAVGGLALLVKLLITQSKSRKCMFMGCGAIGISAALFLLITLFGAKLKGAAFLLYLVLSPYTFTLLAVAMFARILTKKAKNPVVCRNAAIVAAVCGGFMGIASLSAYGAVSALLAMLLFTVTLICLAFVIEPLVFTEYIDIAKHIFLSLITCGIWTLVWIYHVTKNLNKVEGVEERTPRRELLLCMFLLFFFPYWAFKTAEYVETYGEEQGKSFHLEVLSLVFAFICPIFATVMIQNKINVIAGKNA